FEICEASSLEKNIKPVYSQIDEHSIVTEEMFSIINFLVKTTFCTYYEAIKTILPIGSNVEVFQKYKLVSDISEIELITYSETERHLIDFLKTVKTEKEIAKFLDTTGNPAKKAVIKSLLDRGIIEKTESIKQRVTKKTQRMVKLYDDLDITLLRLSKNQNEVCKKLFEVKNATPKEICYLCGVKIGVINNLAKRGIVQFYDCEVTEKYEKINTDFNEINTIILSQEQQKSFEGISNLINDKKPNVALLYGITGSGKTQVYIKLIENVLLQGKTAILLVPEIALTPQMVKKFNALFGNIVAVINSSLTLSQRLDAFEQIKQKKKKIVIGTRSAIFAPLENIGVIILDEEGEHSYKSDNAPRYHAREVAKFRCVQHNATLLLGSATPSIDTYYQAKKG
ncbi:MAG: DEAD/DEAH box helicase family protein, partial [Oscillospiraceae bacterium]